MGHRLECRHWAAKVLALSLVLGKTAVSSAVTIGEPAPALAVVKTFNGPESSEISSALKGKVVVIDFWATWCGPCIASLPHWNDLALAFQGKPVVFLAITDENEDVVAAFLQRNPIRSWVGVDGTDRPTRELFGIDGIPTSVIINQAGTVAAIAHPAKLTAKEIDEVLATGRSSLPPPTQEKSQNEPAFERVSPLRPLVELSVRRSTPRPPGSPFNSWGNSGGQINGKHAQVKYAILRLFEGRETLLDLRTPLPGAEYDFTVRMPTENRAARAEMLASMFRAAFGLRVREVEVESDVYLLTAGATNAPGRILSGSDSRGGGGEERGGLKLGRARIEWLHGYLESWLRRPVIDETGDTNRYDIKLRWKMSSRELLSSTLDAEILKAVLEPTALPEKALTAEQQRQVAFALGTLPDAEAQSIPAEVHQALLLLRAEMAKPEDERFLPDPNAVIAAMSDQLGLKLTSARRTVKKLIVEAAPLAD